MKYQNLKRIFAGFMAAALTLGTSAFVASAEDTTDVTYYLNGERSANGEYVLTVSAQGGLINVGAVEIAYNTDAFEDVEVTFAENIKNADYYMGYNGEIRDGKAEIAFMSAANLDDEDA
ncbi:MAG: hypothetical protein IKU43_06705, partial [Clostridia bacterium]|nr:hypothetical protein [Clostridia bacterium]